MLQLSRRKLILLSSVFTLLICKQADAIISSPAEGDVDRPQLQRGSNFVDPEGWPTIVALSGDAGRCSGTIVGERAILTAAHCVKEDGANSAQIGNIKYSLTCERTPAFKVDQVADLALCETQVRFPDITYERVNTVPVLVTTSQIVMVLGFGCTQPRAVDRSFGALTGGYARITHVDAGINVIELKGSALCNGDGGGPTLLMGDKNTTGSRVILGVNSRGDLKKVSFAVLTSSKRFLSWAEGWAKRKKIKICGLDKSDAGCRRQPPTASPEDLAGPPGGVSTNATSLAVQAPNSSSTDLVVISYKAGESVKEIVERTCGSQPLVYYDYLNLLREKGVLSAQDDAADSLVLSIEQLKKVRFSTPGELNIPECQQASPDVQIHTVQPRDDPFRLYELVVKTYQPEAAYKWLDFKRPRNAGPQPTSREALLQSPYFLESFRALNPTLGSKFVAGKKINLPVAPAPPSDLPSTQQAIVSQNVPVIAAPALPPAVDDTSGHNDELGNFAISNEDLIKLQSSEDCGKSPLPEAKYPYNVRDLLGVLARNRIFRKGEENMEVNPEKTNILVADSGILGVGIIPSFKTELFDTPIHSDLKKHLKNISPLPKEDIEKFAHGTEVTSLVLGGPLFARIHANFARPRSKLNIRRIYSLKQQVFNIDIHNKNIKRAGKRVDINIESMKNMVKFAKSFSGIVNLSFKSKKIIVHLTKKVIEESKDNTLYVVAAGNYDGKINLTAEEGIYPAVYGGDGNDNVITVAALKPSGHLAKLSNFGSSFVDIGAPGCDIPVISSDENREHFFVRRLNGTSVAAPLVTFTSALVKSELGGNIPAREIKRRILVSADILPEHKLKLNMVADRRRLNIVHAASVFDDILVRGEPNQSLWGNAEFMLKASGRILQKDDDIKFCDNVKTKVGRVLKIVPGFVKTFSGTDITVTGTLIYYHDGTSEGRLIERGFCKDVDKKYALLFNAIYPKKLPLKISLNDFKNLILRF